MKNHKLIRFLAYVCSIVLLLCACADGNQWLQTIKKKDLILAGDSLVPSDGLEWHMSQEDFMASSYSSEELDPESEKFEAYLVSGMENGMTCYEPLVEIELKNMTSL